MIEIKVKCNKSFINEKRYTFKILEQLIGSVQFNLNFTNEPLKKYEFILPNEQRILIADDFFHITYDLTQNQDEINKTLNKFASVFFSSDLKKEQSNQILYKIDFIGVCFILLSGLNEFASIKDQHNRNSLNNEKLDELIERPILNEIAQELLSSFILLNKSINQINHKKKSSFFLSHDIDFINYPYRAKQFVKDIYKVRPKQLISRTKEMVKKVNHYDTFDYIMDTSEKNNVTSRFYFMSESLNNKYDNNYSLKDLLLINSIKKIKERGHVIGFHPGYDTYDDPKEWKRQKEVFENEFDIELKEGRQHYLRFDTIKTPKIWEENNMEADSTLGFAESAGYRCGTGDEINLYDFEKRRPFNFVERPLVFMDTTYFSTNYQNSPIEHCYKLADKFYSDCKRFKMSHSSLFHNTAFDPYKNPEWKEFFEYYVKLFSTI